MRLKMLSTTLTSVTGAAAALPLLLIVVGCGAPASAKDCVVGKTGGFFGSEDNHWDAEQMKLLHGALHVEGWASHQREPQLWDDFMAGSGSMCNVEGVCCKHNGVGGGNRVVELYWERNNLKGSFPDSFYKMDQMVNLDFHLNFIKNFPPNLHNMSNLSTAQFGRNPIAGPIPQDFLYFGPQLTKLNCNFCALSGEFPDMFGNLPNLEETYWNGNNFTGSIPPSVVKLKGLTKISFNLNSFSGPAPAGLGSKAATPLVHDCRIGSDKSFKPYDTSDGSPEKKWLLAWTGNVFDCPVDPSILSGICNDPHAAPAVSPVQCK